MTRRGAEIHCKKTCTFAALTRPCNSEAVRARPVSDCQSEFTMAAVRAIRPNISESKTHLRGNASECIETFRQLLSGRSTLK